MSRIMFNVYMSLDTAQHTGRQGSRLGAMASDTLKGVAVSG